jgi:hypothetical protein
MFTKTGPNAVQSFDGFKVAIARRFELVYEDEDSKTVVPIEPMVDGELIVSTSTIPSERRKQLSERISAALNFLSIQHRFD